MTKELLTSLVKSLELELYGVKYCETHYNYVVHVRARAGGREYWGRGDNVALGGAVRQAAELATANAIGFWPRPAVAAASGQEEKVWAAEEVGKLLTKLQREAKERVGKDLVTVAESWARERAHDILTAYAVLGEEEVESAVREAVRAERLRKVSES